MSAIRTVFSCSESDEPLDLLLQVEVLIPPTIVLPSILPRVKIPVSLVDRDGNGGLLPWVHPHWLRQAHVHDRRAVVVPWLARPKLLPRFFSEHVVYRHLECHPKVPLCFIRAVLNKPQHFYRLTHFQVHCIPFTCRHIPVGTTCFFESVPDKFLIDLLQGYNGFYFLLLLFLNNLFLDRFFFLFLFLLFAFQKLFRQNSM